MSANPTPVFRISRPDIQNQDVVGVKASGAGINVIETGAGPIRQTIIECKDVSVTLTDNGTTGSGSVDLYTFPKGVIQVLGASGKLSYSSDLTTDAGLISALGTTAANADGDLADSGEASITPPTASPLASGVGTFTAKSNATTMAAGVFDGSSTAVVARLNVATPNDPTGNKTIRVNGKVVITWVNHGDASGE